MGHRNIPLFIPHLGCPHKCVFCDQKAITGGDIVPPLMVRRQIERTLRTISKDDETEIAFFGGSFTGLPEPLMRQYLDIAEDCVIKAREDGYHMRGIRMSTRPDFISDRIITILKSYEITFVELGIQSMDDSVLWQSRRGHSVQDVLAAAQMLTEAGYPWVAQLMIGLPGSTPENEVETARTIAGMRPDGARIYPTVVFAGSELEKMTKAGTYAPLSLEDAVARSAAVLDILEAASVPVIRIGLCASDELTDDSCAVAGPNHPAIGDLVRSRLMRMKIEQVLKNSETEPFPDRVVIAVPQGTLSLCIGQKRSNLDYLKAKYNIKKLFFTEQAATSVRLFDGSGAAL